MKEAMPKPEQRQLLSFTSKQWSGRPAQDAFNLWLGLGIIGFLISLVLMIFIAGLRDPGAASLFIAIFSVALTGLSIWAKASSEKKFLTGINQRVNETVLELTGNPNDQLSLPDFRKFIENERRLPLPVHGVPGLELRAIRHGETSAIQPNQSRQSPSPPRNSSSARTPVETTTQIIVAITPPDYGTASFDRLLQATLGAG